MVDLRRRKYPSLIVGRHVDLIIWQRLIFLSSSRRSPRALRLPARPRLVRIRRSLCGGERIYLWTPGQHPSRKTVPNPSWGKARGGERRDCGHGYSSWISRVRVSAHLSPGGTGYNLTPPTLCTAWITPVVPVVPVVRSTGYLPPFTNFFMKKTPTFCEKNHELLLLKKTIFFCKKYKLFS